MSRPYVLVPDARTPRMVLDPLDRLEEDDLSPFEGRDPERAADGRDGAIQQLPRETLFAFAGVLFFAHVGLFAASLGLLLVGFRGHWLLGGTLVGVGLASLWLTVRIYRWHERTGSDEEGADADGHAPRARS